MSKFKILWLSQATANTGNVSRYAAVDVTSLGSAADKFLIKPEKLTQYGLKADVKAVLVTLHPEDAKDLQVGKEISFVDNGGTLESRKGASYEKNRQKRNASLRSVAEDLRVVLEEFPNIEFDKAMKMAKATLEVQIERSQAKAAAWRLGGGRQNRPMNLEVGQGVSGSI